MKYLTSRDNPRIKVIAQLSSPRNRRKNDLALIDGIHLVETWLAHADAPQTLIVSENALGTPAIETCLDRARTIGCAEILVLPGRLFDRLAPVETPGGIMAVVSIPAEAPPDFDADSVLLDGIQDPGNVGSIIRSAAAAGFGQILLSPGCAHAWSPKVLRASMGAHVFIRVLERVDPIGWLSRYRGIAAVTTLAPASVSLYATRLPQPIAWVFGSEGQGVSPALLEAASLRVNIPMPGGIESLNVAAAAAICFFETIRQRADRSDR